MGEHVDFDGLAALVRARQLLLDRLTRRLVLVAHGVEAGGWSEAPLRVRVVGVADG